MSLMQTSPRAAAQPVGVAVARRSQRLAQRMVGVLLLGGLTMTAVGCGSPATAEGGSALVLGLPKCDPSLLHPRIAIAAAAALPGKLIVYVDGVMACVDDASRVDQIVSQVEGRSK